MTKADFIHAVSRKSGESLKTTEKLFTAMTDVFCEAMLSGDKITVPGILSIAPKRVAPKRVMNPKTKQEMMTSESKSLSIKVGAVLKRKMNE